MNKQGRSYQSSQTEKPLPNCIEYEEKYLACCLTDSVHLNGLQPEDFYATKNQIIYSILTEPDKKDLPLGTLREILNERDLLDKVGGDEFLAYLGDLIGFVELKSVDFYLQQIKEMSAKRKQWEFGVRLQTLALDDKINSDAVIQKMSNFVEEAGQEVGDSGFSLTKALRLGADLQGLDIQVEYAVNRLIPKGAINLLSSYGGMGKTTITLEAANSISQGIPFLGLETTKMQVVYVDFENSLPTLVSRIRNIDIASVLFWHTSNEIKPPKLDIKGFELYKKLPQESLIIFDTLRASHGLDENSSQDMQFIMGRLRELRDLDFTVLLLHHTNKLNRKQYKGSTAIYDLSDHVLGLYKVKRGTFSEIEDEDFEGDFCYRLGTCEKTRYEPFELFLEFDKNSKRFKLADDPDNEILCSIAELMAGGEPLNQSQICKLVKKELEIKSIGRITSLLKKGIDKYWRILPTGFKNSNHYILIS